MANSVISIKYYHFNIVIYGHYNDTDFSYQIRDREKDKIVSSSQRNFRTIEETEKRAKQKIRFYFKENYPLLYEMEIRR
jgi:hypothetical protein